MVGLAIGAAAAPLLVASFGARGALAAAGGLLALVALVASPRVRRIDARAEGPGPASTCCAVSTIFAPLPQYVQEQLARHLIPVLARPAMW